MSMLEQWRHAPLRIVDISTMHQNHHAAIEVQLYATENGKIGRLAANWYPTTVTGARAFIRAFKGEDSWISYNQLEQFLALEGLEEYLDEINLVLSNQLTLTNAEPGSRFSNRVWAVAVALGLTALIIAPIVAWLFSN